MEENLEKYQKIIIRDFYYYFSRDDHKVLYDGLYFFLRSLSLDRSKRR